METKRSFMSPPKPVILPRGIGPVKEPNNNDVLCGRGGRIDIHVGNVQFREIVREHKHQYLAKSTKKVEKANIAARIVTQIRYMNPPGRFLKEDPDTGLWWDVGDEKARKKAGHALREDAAEIRQVLSAKEAEKESQKESSPEPDQHAALTIDAVVAPPAPLSAHPPNPASSVFLPHSQKPWCPQPISGRHTHSSNVFPIPSRVHGNFPPAHQRHMPPPSYHDYRSRPKKSISIPPPKCNIPPRGIGPVDEPNRNDVLCGRGGRINAHEGNLRFQEIVNRRKPGYVSKTTRKLEKAHIAANIVTQIRSMDPPGRFLKEDPETGLWWDVGDEKAWKKAGQALREDAPAIRHELNRKDEPGTGANSLSQMYVQPTSIAERRSVSDPDAPLGLYGCQYLNSDQLQPISQFQPVSQWSYQQHQSGHPSPAPPSPPTATGPGTSPPGTWPATSANVHHYQYPQQDYAQPQLTGHAADHHIVARRLQCLDSLPEEYLEGSFQRESVGTTRTSTPLTHHLKPTAPKHVAFDEQFPAAAGGCSMTANMPDMTPNVNTMAGSGSEPRHHHVVEVGQNDNSRSYVSQEHLYPIHQHGQRSIGKDRHSFSMGKGEVKFSTQLLLSDRTGSAAAKHNVPNNLNDSSSNMSNAGSSYQRSHSLPDLRSGDAMLLGEAFQEERKHPVSEDLSNVHNKSCRRSPTQMPDQKPPARSPCAKSDAFDMTALDESLDTSGALDRLIDGSGAMSSIDFAIDKSVDTGGKSTDASSWLDAYRSVHSVDMNDWSEDNSRTSMVSQISTGDMLALDLAEHQHSYPRIKRH